MKVAVMQPYIFPYIGYFQMINAVDEFVFYDDVNYIKGGWINRNRILVNGNEKLFTIPLRDASSFKLIKDIGINTTLPAFSKILTTITQNYSKSPYFSDVFPIIENVFQVKQATIADFAFNSVQVVNSYLGITTLLKRSSVDYAESKGLDQAERLIEICKQTGASQYINALGGQELYKKEYFNEKGIKLDFIKSLPVEYKQLKNDFVPWLSIIDVLMFNSIEETNSLLKQYDLV